MRTRAKKSKTNGQRELRLVEKFGWGGRRDGAGRKKNPRAGVPHVRRPELKRSHPLHVTLRMVDGTWNLRSRRSFRILERALLAMGGTGLRLTHFSIQRNHVHLVLEVESKGMLSRAMRGLAIRAAKGLNKMMGRKGRVIHDRYHVRILRTPQQVRNAVNYVLSNTRKHALERGEPLGPVTYDAFAAGPAEHVPGTMELPPSRLLAAAETWLLRVGWSRARRPSCESAARGQRSPPPRSIIGTGRETCFGRPGIERPGLAVILCSG